MKPEDLPKEYRTFKEWSSDGYQILKGSKATWLEGEWKFSDKQVRKLSYQDRPYDEPDESDIDPFDDETWWLDY